MRAFNYREQKIVRIISSIKLDFDGQFLSYLQEKYFNQEHPLAFSLIHPNQQVILYIKSEYWGDNYSVVDKTRKEVSLFLEFIALVEYLKENRYIYVFPFLSEQQQTVTYCGAVFQYYKKSASKFILNNNGDYIDESDASRIRNSQGQIIYNGVYFKAEEFGLYKSISTSLTGLVLPSQELCELVRNEFRTNEEMRFNTQVRISITAIFISIVLGLAGIYLRYNHI
ncbi:hypothetical protein ACSYAD_21880 [Acaryochloris marina NIES-2412]|uniref:hypothetical protein n=1 Tax=Acaryochloris marina TaxID=155978 RepID=UPI0040581AD9